MGRTHALSAAVAWLAMAPVVVNDPTEMVVGTGIAYVAAFLPDVDTPSSTAAKALGPLGTVLAKVLAHRGASHWLLTWIAVGAFTGSLTAWWIGAAVAVGGCAASLGDALTVEGSPLLGPFHRDPVQLPRLQWRASGRNRYLGTFRTGKRFENAVV
jgi:membrane-bound metal-dependent hydrolase YbcI (DUF457 family)